MDIRFTLWALAHPVAAAVLMAVGLAIAGAAIWHDYRRQRAS